MPMLNFRLVRPGHVIDINRVAELATMVPGLDGALQSAPSFASGRWSGPR